MTRVGNMENVHELVKAYLAGASIREVGKEFGLAPSSVFQVLCGHGVEIRKKGEARRLALVKGKFEGKQERFVNESFFESQSKEMAYVLGIVATDGNVFYADSRLKLPA